MSLTPYGPGKFDLNIDALVYDLSLNGPDEECGECNTTGWYGLMIGKFDVSQADRESYDLSDEDVEFLNQTAGAIIAEDLQGFITVEYYDTEDELMETWKELAESVEAEA